MGKNKKKKSNLRIALIFFVIFFLLILTSFIFKFVAVLQKGKFDSSQFTIVVSSGHPYIDIISLSPDVNSASIIKVTGVNPNNVGKILGAPVDAHILFNNNYEEINSYNDIEKLFGKMIFNCGCKSDLTIMDELRSYFFTKKLVASSVKTKEIKIPGKELTDTDYLGIDKELFQYFTDNSMVKEGLTIEIVNGTGVFGLGNRLARVVTNMGGDVVSVSTSDSLINQSEISYFGDKSYTVKRLTKLLGYRETKMTQKEISDVKIVIGKNSLSRLVF